MHTIAVTGATGSIGKQLAFSLLERGITVRAVGRHAGRLVPLTAKGAQARVGDLADTAFLAETFRGADAVFVMIPPNYGAADARGFQRQTAASLTDAIARAGVPRAVALSSLGGEVPSGTGPVAGLHDFEDSLKTISGLSLVFLRPAFFMENHLAGIPFIKSAGIYGGTIRADLAMPMVATRDIAAVAAELLATPTSSGRVVRYILGPRDYTHRETTAILGATIGKPDLAYAEFPASDYRNGMMGAGLSPSVADQIIELNDAINAGRLQAPRMTEATTPTTLEAFAREVFAPAYRGAPESAGDAHR